MGGFCSLRQEKHLQVKIATDASLYKWEATELVLGNVFDSRDNRPNNVKEAESITTLVSISDNFLNHRVDVFVDNQAVIESWEMSGSTSSHLNDTFKLIFEVCQKKYIDLHMHYIPFRAKSCGF